MSHNEQPAMMEIPPQWISATAMVILVPLLSMLWYSTLTIQSNRSAVGVFSYYYHGAEENNDYGVVTNNYDETTTTTAEQEEEESSSPAFWSLRYNNTCVTESQDDDDDYDEPPYAWQKRAPYVIMLGVQKGGTKSLHKYLVNHPWACRQHYNEIHFFDNYNNPTALTSAGIYDNGDEEGNGNSKNNKNSLKATVRRILKEKNRPRIHRSKTAGIPKRLNQYLYANYFKANALRLKGKPAETFCLDDTPTYLLFSNRVPAAIMCVAPWAKMVALVRNPLDRIISHWNMMPRNHSRYSNNHEGEITWDYFLGRDLRALKETGVIQNWTEINFEEWSGSFGEMDAWDRYVSRHLAVGRDLPIGRCLYAIMLEQYYAAMDARGKPRSDLRVVRTEDLLQQSQKVYDEIVVDFLKLPQHTLSERQLIPVHRTNASSVKYPPLPEHWRKTLTELFEPYNRRLYKLLQWDASKHWKNS